MGCCAVWLLRTESVCRKIDLATFIGFLNEQECRKMGMFHSATLQEDYAIARGFTKWVLAKNIGGVSPVDIVIEQKDNAKPYILSVGSDCDFNVSHCDGLVAIAFSPTYGVGIDAERVDAAIDLSIAENYFSQDEVIQIKTLPEAMRSECFFELWTLKEAYLKAVGVGLSGGLQAASFNLRQLPKLGLQLSDAGQWSVLLYQMNNWKIALCVEGVCDGDDIRFYDWTREGISRLKPRLIGFGRQN